MVTQGHVMKDHLFFMRLEVSCSYIDLMCPKVWFGKILL